MTFKKNCNFSHLFWVTFEFTHTSIIFNYPLMSVETNPQDIVSTWVSLCPTIPPGFHEGLETAPSSEAARAFLCLGCFWGSQLRPTILIKAYTQIISLVYISYLLYPTRWNNVSTKKSMQTLKDSNETWKWNLKISLLVPYK